MLKTTYYTQIDGCIQKADELISWKSEVADDEESSGSRRVAKGHKDFDCC